MCSFNEGWVMIVRVDWLTHLGYIPIPCGPTGAQWYPAVHCWLLIVGYNWM